MNKFSKAKSDGLCTNMFVGMDLHKSYLQVAVLDGKGRVLKNSRIHNDLSKVGRFFFVGILSIAISGLVIAHPIGVRLLVVIMSIVLLINGIEMIAIGTVGIRIAGTPPSRERIGDDY